MQNNQENNKGIALYKNHKYKEAIECFQNVIKDGKENILISYLFLGKIYREQGEYEQSEEILRKYIEIDKDKNPHAHLELGKLYRELGRKNDAEKEFKRYIEIDGDKTPHAHLELGKLYERRARVTNPEVKKQRLEQSEAEYKKYIEIVEKSKGKRDTAYAHLELGKLYKAMERLEEAKKEFEKCIEIEKGKIPYVYFELSRLNLELGELEEAERQLKKYIEIDGDKTPHAHLELGKLCVLAKRLEEAEEHFLKCLEINDKNRKEKNVRPDKKQGKHVHFELGKLYATIGELEKAEKELKAYIGEEEKGDGYLELGKVYVKARQLEKAKKMFKKCIDIEGDKSPHAHYELGKVYFFSGQIKEAEDEFEKTREINEYKQTKQEEGNDTKNNKVLIEIKEKIYEGTIENSDIEKIKNNKNQLSIEQYYLVQIAIYERLKQKRKALEIIKQMEKEGIKIKAINKIKERLKSNKNGIFDFSQWDELIGWNLQATEPHQEESVGQFRMNRIIYQAKPRIKSIIDEIIQNYNEKMNIQNEEQAKYIKKYNKLKALLYSDASNKKAEIILMITLISEGYEEIVEEEFPEDYELIKEKISEYSKQSLHDEDIVGTR